MGFMMGTPWVYFSFLKLNLKSAYCVENRVKFHLNPYLNYHRLYSYKIIFSKIFSLLCFKIITTIMLRKSGIGKINIPSETRNVYFGYLVL